MKPEIKAEWIKRLRDGRPQVDSNLEIEGVGQCCLGVLAEIAAENGIVKRVSYKDTAYYGDSDCALNETIYKWAGFDLFDYSDHMVEIKPRKIIANANTKIVTITNLAEANDFGQSFEQIADIIEKEF